jgi:hypothetical protein
MAATGSFDLLRPQEQFVYVTFAEEEAQPRPAQGVTVVGIARQCLGLQHELAARGTGVGGDDRNLDAELVGRAGLAFANALDLRGVEGIELPAALALALRALSRP